MVDEARRAEMIRIGRLAEDVLENDAFVHAMNIAMNGIFSDFLATSAGEEEVRERLWATGQAMDRLRNSLDALVQNGTAESRNKAEDAKSQER